MKQGQRSARLAELLAVCILGLAGCPNPGPDNTPVADFSASTRMGFAPLVVQFVDESTLAAGEDAVYLWNFGDGRQSSKRSPLHVYQLPGDYTVSLTVTTPSGTDTERKVAYVGVLMTNAMASIEFADANLEAAVRAAMDIPTDPISIGQAIGVEDLEIIDYPIADLGGLQHFTSLKSLRISGAYAEGGGALDLWPLSRLTHLTELQLDQCGISDLSPLVTLENLSVLYVYGNSIEDLSPVADLSNLTVLYAYNNYIENLGPLAGLTQLRVLNLYGNLIEDVEPLEGLTQLDVLYLDNNQITNISGLGSLFALTALYLGMNDIVDISPLVYLTDLQFLGLNDNHISDILPLTYLDNLSFIYLQGNPLTPQAACHIIEELSDAGVEVHHDVDCGELPVTAEPSG